MDRHLKYRAKAIHYIVYFVMIIFVFFYPTSQNGVISAGNDVKSTYIYYGIVMTISILYFITNNISTKRIRDMSLLFVYLIIATFFAELNVGGGFSIARFIYIIVPMLIICTDDVARFNRKFILYTMELLNIIIIAWNVLLIMKNPTIMDLTKNAYSQFLSFTTTVFVDRGSPIFTFGIYSYGAFFYAGLFMFWFIAYQNSKGFSTERYNLYMIILIIFQVLLRGSTALFLGMFMLFVYLRTFAKNKLRFLLLPIFLLAGVCFIYVQNYDWSRLIVGNSSNGFIARYGTNLFEGNFQVVKDTILGIGFTIARNYAVNYTDSGYIVLFTMGNIILPLLMYMNLYKKIKFNTPKNIYMFLFVMYMLFEFSLPGIIYTRLTIFMGFLLLSIRNIIDEKSILTTGRNQYLRFTFRI